MRPTMLATLFLTLGTSALHAQVVRDHMLITPYDGQPGVLFGASVAAHDDLVVIGAPNSRFQGAQSGKAYVYRISTGELVHEFLPAETDQHDLFGKDVAISDEFIVVSAPGRYTPEGGSGAVYVFDRQTGTLARTIYFPEHEFGTSINQISVHESQLLIMATVDVYPTVSMYNLNTGDFLLNIAPSDPSVTFRGGQDSQSIDLDGTHAAIGMASDQNNQYSVRLFDAASGTETLSWSPSNPAALLGAQLTMTPSSVIAYAPFEQSNPGPPSSSGVLYVFDRASGTQTDRIAPESPWLDTWSVFTNLVHDANTLVYCLGQGFGVATEFHVYDTINTSETTRFRLLGVPSVVDYPTSLELSGSQLLVGDFLMDSHGAVIVLDINNTSCLADYDLNGTVNAFDVFQYVEYFVDGDLLADIIPGDGLNFFDVAAFLDAYEQGCP